MSDALKQWKLADITRRFAVEVLSQDDSIRIKVTMRDSVRRISCKGIYKYTEGDVISCTATVIHQALYQWSVKYDR